ncbi:MAG: hypothetical protein GF353_22215 [Candidatus Lokiarchaeota archaeon]|nr:hypothetical protein [Candidatus Lokiarchaeota archaeon]
MKVINLIGYSGSGKTFFVVEAIKGLRERYTLNCAVIKNIHEHQIDEEGKDSYLYSQAGANYSITKNIYDETTIFLKKKISIPKIIKWLSQSPLPVDLVFTEGFRSVDYPTILCAKKVEDIKNQMNDNVRMIAGMIALKKYDEINLNIPIPIVNIKEQFEIFLEIFEIKK